MFNPQFAEVIARQHRQELLDSAARFRAVRGQAIPRRHRLRTAAGRGLMRAGTRLALVQER